MIAICLRGPAGVGKTTIAYELARVLRRRGLFQEKLGYISADMFAHISLDCQYAEWEIDLKYRHIELILRNLAMCTIDLIYDDTYRRPCDYQFIETLLEKLGYHPIHKFFIFAPFEVALERNKARFWKERLSDELIAQHYHFHRTLTVLGEIEVNGCLEVAETTRLMADIITGSM